MKKNIFTIPLFSYNYNGDMDLLENNIQANAKLGRGVKRSNVNGFQSRPDLPAQEFMQPFMRWLCENAGEAFEELGHTRQHVNVEGQA